jgi:gliding motility-associated-like protein
MRLFSTLFFIFYAAVSFAQGETNIWHFGRYSGLDFNGGSPVAITGGQTFQGRGSSVMSDASGQLLFYSDGIDVWDRNHQVMPNGNNLAGNIFVTQACIIVPLPGSSTIYYIFTTNIPNFLAEGNSYSIVDMSLNGGNGDVTVKNVLLSTPSVGRIAVVKKSNDEYWVFIRVLYENNFYAYSLTSLGLNPVPVISSSGVSMGYETTTGHMKISPEGDKLVCATALGLELFDLDINTGIVSNPLMLDNRRANVGVEFSPSGRFLYITFGDGINLGDLGQYDLFASDIISSKIIIGNMYYEIGALQLGSDNKIYTIRYPNTFLDVIHNPENLGVSCNFQLNALNLNTLIDVNGEWMRYVGLPNFVSSYFSSFSSENLCLGQTTNFNITNTTDVTNVNWDFGDGNFSNGTSVSHVYSATGTYTVSAEITKNLETIVKTKQIKISAVPSATQPNNILECDTDNNGFLNFDLTQNEAAILNGQSTTQFGVNYYANAADFANKIIIPNPSIYQNNTAYLSQTIIAVVYNKDNNSCVATTNFNIHVFESPLPATTVNLIEKCDDTSFGIDNDGRVVFDLRQRENDILNGQSASIFTVEYYRDNTLTNLIVNPSNYVNTNATETIYVKVFNTQNPNCFATTSFQIEVFALPIINSVATLKQCDDNNDGYSAFNLTEAQSLIVSDLTGLTIGYFETITEAQNNSNPITNLTAYINQTVSLDRVYVRITNANGCYRIADLNLVVSTTQIANTIQETFTQCDDIASGSNTDGIATFNFSSTNAQIVAQYPVGQLLDITYYRNLADALAEQNAIADISNYTNIGYPNMQYIYVRVDSQLNNECIGLGHHITLNVESIPIVQPQSYTECDDDQDGIFGFNTTTLENNLLNGLTNVTVQYWDANNIALPSPLPNPFNTVSQVVKVRVTNNTATACYYETTITFTVDDLPEAFAVATSLTTVCDDELNPVNQDGLYAFDTSSFQSTILGSQTGRIVRYFDGLGNLLSSPLPNPFITATQNILVEVINPINPNCVATTTIPFIVHPVPEIELYGDELVCSDNPTFTKEINAGLLDVATINNFTYTWFFNGILIPTETNYDLTVNTEGIYTVEVSNINGCYRTRTITVTASDVATIDNVVITELSDNNSIVVFVSGQGDYEFSLDNEFYQSSNSFEDLEAGIYTVFVKDLNGCGVATREISILGIPNYFTPNADGYNDYWNIKGVNTRLNSKTIIYIFDRYGKLLKQISPAGQGWDGTYNGELLPASDYWYAVTLENGKTVKGHFTLKR